MIIERLSREHRNVEALLAVLERELAIFDRGDRPDYQVIRGIIYYFELYPELYHHPLVIWNASSSHYIIGRISR
jgi:hemerythrin-like domain-containing protein